MTINRSLPSRASGRRGCVLLLVVAAALASCSGQDGAEPDTGTAAVTAESTSAPTSPASSPSSGPSTSEAAPKARTTVPEATVPEEFQDLGAAISVMSQGRLVLFPPDAGCLERTFAALPLRVRRALDALVADPIEREGADQPALEEGLLAYLQCMGPGALSGSVALSVVKLLDFECVAEAWSGLLPADLVASSLVYGVGLDDLPADVVDELARTAAECQPNREWWIDDVLAQDEIGLDVPEPQVKCIAVRYVNVMGINEVIRRRLLNAPLLALPPEHEARLDLPATCGVTARGLLELLVADAGACVANFRTGRAAVIDCDQAHDAEVVATHDLAAAHPSWPGIRQVVETAGSLCHAGPQVVADPGDHDFIVVHPRRRSWEQGDRSALCLVVHDGDGEWIGPSGLVPAAPGSTPTTVATTTTRPEVVPTGTTLPPGARELLSLAEVNRVGMCIYRAPALPGQDDLSRRFFEVDCGQPHQAQMYHRFVLAGAPGSPYPGDDAILTEGDAVCTLTFAAYVGIPYEASRLRFTYFYPSVDTWKQGDRSVICFLVGTQVDELLSRSMAGAAE